MESPLHTSLKTQGLRWLLRSAGCPAAAVEVRCPLSRYRLDVAGYLDPLPKRRTRSAFEGASQSHRGESAGSIVIECKASRADFLSDSRLLPALLARRQRQRDELARVQREYVHTLEPHLRSTGSALFPDMEAWDYSASQVRAHRVLVRELRRLDAQIHDSTKFFMLAHYRLATHLYLLAPAGMLSASELPFGWGLLELTSASQELGADPIRVTLPAVALESRSDRTQRLLRNIAAAATQRTLAAGIASSAAEHSC